MADIFPWKFRAFWGQDKNTSSQEIAKQVRDDMKSLVGQIVYKQRVVLCSFDSLTVSFENRTQIWCLNLRNFYPEQFFKEKTKDKLKQFRQKHRQKTVIIF